MNSKESCNKGILPLREQLINPPLEDSCYSSVPILFGVVLTTHPLLKRTSFSYVFTFSSQSAPTGTFCIWQ